jgi:hypothetical protein
MNKNKEKIQNLTFTVTTILKEDDSQTCSVDYDPEDLRPLCMALITDPYMSETAKAATAFLMATTDDLPAFLEGLQNEAERMRREMKEG